MEYMRQRNTLIMMKGWSTEDEKLHGKNLNHILLFFLCFHEEVTCIPERGAKGNRIMWRRNKMLDRADGQDDDDDDDDERKHAWLIKNLLSS